MFSYKGIAIIKSLIFVLVCAFATADAQVRCIAREREALLTFKNGLVDEDGVLSSWRSDECCEWYGIECDDTTGHVITLQLDTFDDRGVLQGKVGPSLLELHHLHHLDLSHNSFRGNPIPEFISSMKNLQHLYLRSSYFSGTVPPQIGNLTNLRSLDLSYNSLRVENLNWLSSLSFLSFLDLSRVELSHTNWLHSIVSLQSLHELNLASCNIKDVEPFVNSSSTSLSILDLSANHLTSASLHWLPNISTTLVKLDLSHNALNGPIPYALERFTLVEHLDLSSNMLQGPLPKSLGNLSRLRVLVLYRNDLRGDFHDLFGNISAKGIEILDLAGKKLTVSVLEMRGFSALTELYLGGNNFTGSVPLSLGRLSGLEVLDLSNNSLEGSLSESHFIKLHKLKVLDLCLNPLILHVAPDWSPHFQLDYLFLEGCKVRPSFPKWIQSQRSFLLLDLSRAGITDEAPTWLWSVSPSLKFLFLSHNQITGTIPDLSSTPFTGLDVSNNTFSGPIPLFFAHARIVQLSGNKFSGSISSICETPHDQLRYFDVSNNQLAGEVPNCFEKMPNLFFLNLANNAFSGEIPPSLGSLHHLFALQLHGNSLSGELPSTMRHCQDLNMIDVGGNELTGEIPSWIGQLSRVTFLNMARNKLHGSIPLEICSLTHVRILDLSMNTLSGEIPDYSNNFSELVHKDTTQADLHFFGFVFWFYYKGDLPNGVIKRYYEYSSFQWKGNELEYRKNLELLKLIDLSSNALTGNIPQSFSAMRGLISLNLSRNFLTGDMIQDIGEMEMLECLDLSHNQLSGKLHTSLAELHYLAVLDLSENRFSGKIPTSTQLQSFNASAYAGNDDGLCGAPLAECREDSLRPPGGDMSEKESSLCFMQSMAIGFVVGFWGVVGSLLVKIAWRNAYFNFIDDVGDWFYVKTAVFVSELR